jgi:hypothetical protein
VGTRPVPTGCQPRATVVDLRLDQNIFIRGPQAIPHGDLHGRSMKEDAPQDAAAATMLGGV